ncbi:MAG: HNH endonuclease [Bacteroidales bacterium]|nr:HNH endonuclease [Bacteroidales bacterium]
MPLTIELVPYSNWAFNLRSILTEEQWGIVRRAKYKEANYRCEICGNQTSKYFNDIKHPVECHEIWKYDDINKIQSLDGLIALCHDCHRAKHIGKANADGVSEVIYEHIANVNDWDIDSVEKYISECFDVWEERSKYNWTLKI